MYSMSGKRILVLGIVCGAVIPAAFWLPSTVFYLVFQTTILANDPRGVPGSILRPKPAEAASPGGREGLPERREGRPGGWGQILHGGILFPLPPGELRKAALEGETIVIEMSGARLTVDRLPPGTIRRMYASELARVGGD